MDNNYKYEICDNGLKILLIPMKNTKLINLQLALNIGYDNESIEEKNLEVSHLLEHLFSSYTSKKYPRFEKISNIFSELGVVENASVTYNITKYDLSFEKKHLELILDIIKNTYTDFKIDSKILSQEISSVKEEINNILDDQYTDLNDKIIKALYPNHIRGISQKINLKNVDKLTNKQIYDFYKKNYMPMLSTIIIAGDIELNLINKLKKTFGNLQNKKYCLKNLNIENKLNKKLIYSKSKNDNLCNMNIIFKVNTTYFEDRYFSQNALSHVCTADLNSIFLKILRTKEGLLYDISYDISLDERFSTLSNIHIKTTIDNKNTIKFLKRFFIILKDLKKKLITQQDMKKYKNNIKLEMLKDNLNKDPEQYINIYGRNIIFDKEIETSEYVYKRFLSLTKNDLQTEAKNTFVKENMLIAYASSKNMNKKINELLDNLIL